jgi:hypothetical protein
MYVELMSAGNVTFNSTYTHIYLWMLVLAELISLVSLQGLSMR